MSESRNHNKKSKLLNPGTDKFLQLMRAESLQLRGAADLPDGMQIKSATNKVVPKEKSLQLIRSADHPDGMQLTSATNEVSREEKSLQLRRTTDPGVMQSKIAPNALHVRQEAVQEASGVQDLQLATQLAQEAGSLVLGDKTNKSRVEVGLATLRELAPENATESMLAVQMTGVHHAAVMFLQRGTRDGETSDSSNSNILQATRLMRLFNEQLVAMAKLKGKTGQQRVTVEHVQVNNVGQTIVGGLMKVGDGNNDQ